MRRLFSVNAPTEAAVARRLRPFALLVARKVVLFGGPDRVA